jgi:multiple sugar transport system substrate-binding protein
MLSKRLAPSLLVLALVSGCNSATQSSATTQPSTATTQPSTATQVPASSAPAATTLTFGMNSSASLLPTAKLLQDNFAKTHPEVKVDLQLIANDDIAPTFYKDAAAGTLPDVVFTADSYVLPFVENKVALDMEPLAKADSSFDLSDIYPNLLGLSQVNGKGLYMIPSSFDVVTMFYNKDLFAKAGAPLPAAEWTWDDFTAACKTVFEKTGSYCFANGGNLPGFDWWAYFVPFVAGYGGKIISDDSKTMLLTTPEALAGEQAYVDMWTKDKIAQPLDFDSGNNCFFDGKCATMFLIPGLMNPLRDPATKIGFDWDVQVIPSHPNGKFTGMGTYGFAVSANSKNPQLAWDFVKYMASKDAQLALLKTYSGMPLLKSLATDPTLSSLAGPPANIKAFIDNGKNGIFPPSFPGSCGSVYAGEVSSDLKDALEASIRGTSSVADAFATANTKIQTCLDKAP